MKRFVAPDGALAFDVPEGWEAREGLAEVALEPTTSRGAGRLRLAWGPRADATPEAAATRHVTEAARDLGQRAEGEARPMPSKVGRAALAIVDGTAAGGARERVAALALHVADVEAALVARGPAADEGWAPLAQAIERALDSLEVGGRDAFDLPPASGAPPVTIGRLSLVPPAGARRVDLPDATTFLLAGTMARPSAFVWIGKTPQVPARSPAEALAQGSGAVGQPFGLAPAGPPDSRRLPSGASAFRLQLAGSASRGVFLLVVCGSRVQPVLAVFDGPATAPRVNAVLASLRAHTPALTPPALEGDTSSAALYGVELRVPRACAAGARTAARAAFEVAPRRLVAEALPGAPGLLGGALERWAQATAGSSEDFVLPDGRACARVRLADGVAYGTTLGEGALFVSAADDVALAVLAAARAAPPPPIDAEATARLVAKRTYRHSSRWSESGPVACSGRSRDEWTFAADGTCTHETDDSSSVSATTYDNAWHVDTQVAGRFGDHAREALRWELRQGEPRLLVVTHPDGRVELRTLELERAGRCGKRTEFVGLAIDGLIEGHYTSANGFEARRGPDA